MFGANSTIKNIVEEGDEALAPTMGGKIVRKQGIFYLVTQRREMEIPDEVLQLIKVRKENNKIIAYSE